MKPIKKITQNQDDYWRIRTFLRHNYIRNDRQPLSWPPPRLDYWKWHVAAVSPQNDDPSLAMWETADGEIVAALLPEGKANMHLQVHPEYDTPGLIEEMVKTAEERYYRTTDENKKRLYLWAHNHDKTRGEILAARGFKKLSEPGWPEIQRTRFLDAPLPEFETAEGYTIRALGGPEEVPSRSWASWRAFHPDSPDEDYDGWDWYPVNIQTQPMYRRDLDIVAIAPDGEVAAFTTLWYDDLSRTGYFEPVGTVPEHQRKGLGKTVMVEAMRRIKKMGALAVEVSSYSEAANKLYAAVVSEDCLVYTPWRKEW